MYVEMFGGPQDGLVVDVPPTIEEILFPVISTSPTELVTPTIPLELRRREVYVYKIARRSRAGRYLFEYQRET